MNDFPNCNSSCIMKFPFFYYGLGIFILAQDKMGGICSMHGRDEKFL